MDKFLPRKHVEAYFNAYLLTFKKLIMRRRSITIMTLVPDYDTCRAYTTYLFSHDAFAGVRFREEARAFLGRTGGEPAFNVHESYFTPRPMDACIESIEDREKDTFMHQGSRPHTHIKI